VFITTFQQGRTTIEKSKLLCFFVVRPDFLILHRNKNRPSQDKTTIVSHLRQGLFAFFWFCPTLYKTQKFYKKFLYGWKNGFGL